MKSGTKNKKAILIGRVKAGLGEGRYYMSQQGYKAQFIKKLGIDPYRGTLNLKLSPKNVKTLARIKDKKGIIIHGFKMGGKTFGDVLSYNADISGIKCALVIPKLSTHFETAEIISSEYLRTKLKLNDGSIARVSIDAE